MSATRSALFVLLLLLLPGTVRAQFGSGIQGTVTDGQQALVPDATVRVTNITTGVTREAVTSADGVYRVMSLGPGAYRVEVEKPGFVKTQRDKVTLGISETIRVDFALELSGVTETVTVATRAPLVETEQGRVSGRVDRLQLQELPLSGRNLYNLIALQPGVTGRGFAASISGGGGANDSFAGESAPQINASGQRDEANSYTVDDTSTNGVARGGITNLTPNTESVEEVRVVANNFSAVDGRNPGAQIQVITKGGTNQFRGSGSYYFQGDKLSARNVFEQSVPEFERNQFGYSLGGPVIRNRIFFFTSYEGLRHTGARGSTFTVETPQLRNYVLQTRPNSTAAQLMRTFAPAVDPTTNFRDLGSPALGVNTIGPADGIMDVGSAFFVPEGWRRGNQFNVRMDYELRPGKDRLYGSFYRTDSYAVSGGIRPPFNRPTPNWTHFGNVNYTHTFSSTKLNELRVGVMRLVGLPDTPKHLEIPGINITGASGFGQSGYPNGWWQTNWHFKNVFTWVKSAHMIKTGAELRQMYGSASNTNNYIPAYSFSNLLNFIDDEPLQMTRYVDPRTGEPVTAYSELTQTEWALFINDDWKVTRRLTINAGLRYENYGTFKDSDGTLRNIIPGSGATFAEQLASARVDFIDRFFPTDNNNIGPRLGFAWDPTGSGQTAIRGGYGLAFDRLMNLPAENYRHSPPLRASVVLGQQFGTPQFTYSLGDANRAYLGYPVDPALRVGLDSRNGVIGARVNLTVVDPDLESPYVHNWFLGAQREIVFGIVADANYVGSVGRNLHNAYNVNRYVGDLLDGRFDGYNPSFSSINMVRSNSKSRYHGGTLTLKRNFQQNFMLQGAYTFGRAMDDTDLAVGTTSIQDAANLAGDWAVAGYDVAHKLSLVGLWELPFFQNPGLTRTILGGWQLAGSAILQSGSPLNVVNNAAYPTGDFNADGTGGDRPNAPASSVKQSGWSKDEYLTGIFRASDFPRPAPGTNGTLVRNAFRGPGYIDVSLSLSKKFRFNDKWAGEFRFDAFNALNRVNLDNPSMDLSSNNFGRSTSQLTPRAFQLGLRLRF